MRNRMSMGQYSCTLLQKINIYRFVWRFGHNFMIHLTVICGDQNHWTSHFSGNRHQTTRLCLAKYCVVRMVQLRIMRPEHVVSWVFDFYPSPYGSCKVPYHYHGIIRSIHNNIVQHTGWHYLVNARLHATTIHQKHFVIVTILPLVNQHSYRERLFE